jgi:hypothetical protein
MSISFKKGKKKKKKKKEKKRKEKKNGVNCSAEWKRALLPPSSNVAPPAPVRPGDADIAKVSWNLIIRSSLHLV